MSRSLERTDGAPEPPVLPHADLVETHISWVLLTGDRAFKVKKPVAYPFLDYREPGRRRELCEEEVRLNRRLAPDLYVGVRGLARSGDAWSLTAPAAPEAVEWAVEMHRFDESDTLASRIAAGSAGREAVAAVGALLARFHVAARRVAGGSSIAASMRGNLDTLEGTGAVPGRVVAAGPRFTEAFLASGEAGLRRRADAGLVREGHGDLRAEHVLLRERIEVFDCIEFSRELREIDVGADLAFLVMDLEHAGRGDLAEELVSAYRAAGGDPGDDELLAFFACYRAWVRATVRALRAGESGEGPARAAVVDEALAFAATARRLAWRARGPRALVIGGASATGKTYLATRLAAASGWRHVSSDVVRKELIGLRPERRAPTGAYTPAMSERTYQRLGVLAREELDRGRGAIVDATFRFRRDRAAFARGLGEAATLHIECRAPAAELARRAARREAERGRVSDADADEVERQQRELEPLDEVPAGDREAIRTDRPVELIADEVERALDSRLALEGPMRRGSPPRAAEDY